MFLESELKMVSFLLSGNASLFFSLAYSSEKTECLHDLVFWGALMPMDISRISANALMRAWDEKNEDEYFRLVKEISQEIEASRILDLREIFFSKAKDLVFHPASLDIINTNDKWKHVILSGFDFYDSEIHNIKKFLMYSCRNLVLRDCHVKITKGAKIKGCQFINCTFDEGLEKI